MVLHNPNNWHWVDKDVSTWTTEHLKKTLTQVSSDKDGVDVRISSVTSVEGDADVCQRKGKVITLFDLVIKLAFTAKVDDVEITGTILIPEATQDAESADDLVFNITTDGTAEQRKESEKITQVIRSGIVPQLVTELTQLKGELIKNHGGDLQHAPGETVGKVQPAPVAATNAAKPKTQEHAVVAAATQQRPVASQAKVVNVSSVSYKTEFRTNADEAYTTFTSVDRIAAFTRDSPKQFDAKVDGEFVIFGGNVSGRFIELEKPTKVVQEWRLAQWPAGHHSLMTLEFTQDDNMGITKVNLEWKDIPVGQEDLAKKYWDEYYVKSINWAFGFGTVL